MKLLASYTLDYIKRNRRSSVSITIAILITSTMLSAFFAMMYTIYMDNLNYTLKNTGNWHGELFDDTLGSHLPIIESMDSVDAIMIKGDWTVAKIDDPRRQYLIWRDATANYWDSMPEGSLAILEGRPPKAANELALSKQYFEYHPDLKLGDTISLPIGNRIAPDGSIIRQTKNKIEGERFVQTGTMEKIVVAKMDATTSSSVPAYTALGFLEEASITSESNLTVYLRFKKIEDTYKELPKVAAAVGYQPDEYGEYLVRYNTPYLYRRGILPLAEINITSMLTANQVLLMSLFMGLMIVALFVLIIHNAFSLSFSSRLKQLGIFASVGATPKQIKKSVLLEGFFLSIIPLPVGLLLGQMSVYFLCQYTSKISPDTISPVVYACSWESILPPFLFTILTVWWSALLPAKRVAKLSPIHAIRQGGTENLKKVGRLSWGGWFGIAGELAGNSLQSRKKSYRTATISLTLSFLTLGFFLCVNSASTASRTIYKTDEKKWEDRDVLLSLSHVETFEDFLNIKNKIQELPSVTKDLWYSTLRTAIWIPEAEFSKEFYEKGGFHEAEKMLSKLQTPLLRDGKRRVGITLVGMDDASFSEYCNKLNVDPSIFYKNDQWRSILYNTVNDITTSTKRNPVLIPFLQVAPGDTITLTETTSDSYNGDFTFGMEVVALSKEKPTMLGNNFGVRYSAIAYMPISQLRELSTHFSNSSAFSLESVIQVSDPSQIATVRTIGERFCESYFGSGDYSFYDENEYYSASSASNQLTFVMFVFVSVLLAAIGISNAWSTVLGAIHARKREFAMLQSVGLSPKNMKKMLLMEGVIFGITPILLALPILLILQGVFLSINEVSLLEWIPFIPWVPVFLYLVGILGTVTAVYMAGYRQLSQANIVQSIKGDTF